MCGENTRKLRHEILVEFVISVGEISSSLKIFLFFFIYFQIFIHLIRKKLL